jgi:hypothetical protein
MINPLLVMFRYGLENTLACSPGKGDSAVDAEGCGHMRRLPATLSLINPPQPRQTDTPSLIQRYLNRSQPCLQQCWPKARILGNSSAGFEALAQSLKSHVSFQSRIKYGRIYPMLIMID